MQTHRAFNLGEDGRSKTLDDRWSFGNIRLIMTISFNHVHILKIAVLSIAVVHEAKG